MEIKIVNWGKYQSYKDRRPPWIRFHRTILDDYTFQSMSAESRALLPMLWLLACENKDPTSGLICKSIDEIAFRLRLSEIVIMRCIDELQAVDFIECIKSVTKPLQDRNETVTPETETETETDCAFATFWDIYPKKKDKKKAEVAFVRMSKVKQEKAIADVRSGRFAETAQQFIPFPTTYIHGERWNDDIEQSGSADDLFKIVGI